MTMFLEPLIGIDQTILFTMELAAGNDRQSSQCMMSLVIGYFRVSEYPGQSWKCPLLPVRLMRTGVSSRRDIPVCNAVPMLLAWAARRPQVPFINQVFEHAGVVKKSSVDLPLHPWRYQNRRHPKAVLIKRILLLIIIRWNRGRRRHMVIKAAVLIINDRQQCGFPQRGIGSQCVVRSSP